MASIALALLLGQISTADLSAPVSFEHRAAPIGRVLSKLSETSKLKLEAGPTVAGEVILVSVRGVPIGELLEKIATVASAEWKKEGDLYRLTASAGVRNREAQEEYAAKYAALRATVDERVKQQRQAANAKPNSALPVPFQMGLGMGVRNSSSEIAFTTLLQGLDLRPVAALGANERIVFSTRPTRTQKPLTGNIDGIVASLVAGHNAEVKKTEATEDIDQSPMADQIPQYMKDMFARRSRPIGEVTKGLVVVSKMGFLAMGGMDSVSLELRLYDRHGKIAYTTNTMLQVNPKSFKRLVESVQNKPQGTKTTPIEFSSESKAIQSTISGGMSSLILRLKPEAKALIFQPDRFDPLSFMATDSLLAVAKKRQQPVVASMPDDMVGMTAAAVAPTKTVESVEAQLQEAEVIRTVPDEKFLLIKPAKPASARANRLDRAALATLMRIVETKTIPSLEDVAAYATKAPSPLENGIGQVYIMMFAPGAFAQSMSGFTNWEALRFFGLLTSDAQRNLAAGGRIPFALLTTAQTAQIRRMAFGTTADLTVEDSTRPKPTTGMPNWMKMFGMGTDVDYRTEPTEVMPDGLPGDGYVSAEAIRDFFATPVTIDDEPASGPIAVLGAEELAVFQMFREEKSLSAIGNQMPAIDRVKVGERTTWNFAFHVAPGVSIRTSLNDNRLPIDSKAVMMSEIPSGFKKRIAIKLEEVKKSPLGALGGLMGGRQVSPPP